jgi:hypothetical protein
MAHHYSSPHVANMLGPEGARLRILERLHAGQEPDDGDIDQLHEADLGLLDGPVPPVIDRADWLSPANVFKGQARVGSPGQTQGVSTRNGRGSNTIAGDGPRE